MQLIERKGGKVRCRSGDITASIDDREEIVVGEKSYRRTVRRF